MNTKNIEYYMSLTYPIQVIKDIDEDGEVSYFAQIVALKGCMTQVDTLDELDEMIDDSKRLWLEMALEEDMTIPEPENDSDYSGKFVLRLPKSLHRSLAQKAKRDGVSLNQFVVALLAGQMTSSEVQVVSEKVDAVSNQLEKLDSLEALLLELRTQTRISNDAVIMAQS